MRVVRPVSLSLSLLHARFDPGGGRSCTGVIGVSSFESMIPASVVFALVEFIVTKNAFRFYELWILIERILSQTKNNFKNRRARSDGLLNVLCTLSARP